MISVGVALDQTIFQQSIIFDYDRDRITENSSTHFQVPNMTCFDSLSIKDGSIIACIAMDNNGLI